MRAGFAVDATTANKTPKYLNNIGIKLLALSYPRLYLRFIHFTGVLQPSDSISRVMPYTSICSGKFLRPIRSLLNLAAAALVHACGGVFSLGLRLFEGGG